MAQLKLQIKFLYVLVFVLVTFSLIYLGGNYMEKKKLEKHIISVVEICNNSSWETYDGLQGKDFFSPSLQEKYFFKNREEDRLETLEYDKKMQVVSTCKVDTINRVDIKGNNAEVDLQMTRTITDINRSTTFSTDATFLLSKNENGDWIIYDLSYKPHGKNKYYNNN